MSRMLNMRWQKTSGGQISKCVSFVSGKIVTMQKNSLTNKENGLQQENNSFELSSSSDS